MNLRLKRFLLTNVFGGLAVLGSYGFGLATHPASRDALWGGVPASWQWLYTASMLTATAGYFAFTSWFAWTCDPERGRYFAGRSLDAVTAIYALLLVSAALWMPLTFANLETPNSWLWVGVRAVLATTGASSLALIAALFTSTPRPSRAHFVLAFVGLMAFCFQTAVLDAIVWVAYQP
ncbi:MAG: hypothetical protein ACI8TX_001427 [Hyphomicrobiaceae bacterium]|jgi:hypothetical protein